MENLFTQLMQITGTNTLVDVVAKFAGQHTNRAALEKEKAEAKVLLAAARVAQEKDRQ